MLNYMSRQGQTIASVLDYPLVLSEQFVNFLFLHKKRWFTD
nr:MAG TPA: hypothetical protein [Microviridae sp.]